VSSKVHLGYVGGVCGGYLGGVCGGYLGGVCGGYLGGVCGGYLLNLFPGCVFILCLFVLCPVHNVACPCPRNIHS